MARKLRLHTCAGLICSDVSVLHGSLGRIARQHFVREGVLDTALAWTEIACAILVGMVTTVR